MYLLHLMVVHTNVAVPLSELLYNVGELNNIIILIIINMFVLRHMVVTGARQCAVCVN